MYVHRELNIELRCKFCDYEAPAISELETSFKHANAQLDALEAHIKDVHVDIAKPGVCNQCQFTTYHGPTLTSHMKSLHNLKCQLCGFESKTTKGLRIHIDTAHIRKNNSK